MHYEFTGKTKEWLGRTLHQIRATKDLPQHNVKSGDVGGWIESEKNLSGNAWVSGNARVCGNARVYGNAWVYGDALVYGNARVYGDAWDTSPLYIQGSRWSVCMSSKSTLKVGCQDHTLEHWKKHYKAIARANDAEDIIDEYMMYYNVAVARYGKAEEK